MVMSHSMYLSKQKTVQVTDSEKSLNTFVFADAADSRSVRGLLVRNIQANNNSIFVFSHMSEAMEKGLSKYLKKQNYCIESFDPQQTTEQNFFINPFTLVSSTRDIHFLFSSIYDALLHQGEILGRAQSALLDAYANYVFTLFPKENRTIGAFMKLVQAGVLTCNDIPMYRALFEEVEDKTSQPYVYYKQFCQAAGTQEQEIAEEVANVIARIPLSMQTFMHRTESSVQAELAFKTAFFLRGDAVEQKLQMILLNELVRVTENHLPTFFVVNSIDLSDKISSLPYWLSISAKSHIDYMVFSTEETLQKYNSNAAEKKYIQGLLQNFYATILIHAQTNSNVATISIPGEGFEEEQEIL